ncbi:hypothetical protein LRP50_25475, partial [Enterovibrio sp. ZSDZ42]|nr:hypothetical protein [Enterovibrio sp. ZSDZ42]
FSPKPMPAYYLKDDDTVPSSEILDINDAYMDIGARCQGKAFQVQFGHICINAVTLLVITVLVSVAYSNSNVTGGSYFGELLRGLGEIEVVLYIFYAICGGVVWFVIIKTSFDYARQRPIRFHRQRREICYYPDGSNTPVIAPWEQVVSWVALTRGTTGTNVMTTYTFGIAIPTPDGKDYWL